jgi:hypothetical protein
MSQDKPWELCLTARSKKLQEKPLEVQSNSQDVFGYMPLPKESWFRYMKSSKESWPTTLSAQNLTSTVALRRGSLCSQLSESSEFKVYGRLTGTKICDKPPVFPSNVKPCLYGWKVSASVYKENYWKGHLCHMCHWHVTQHYRDNSLFLKSWLYSVVSQFFLQCTQICAMIDSSAPLLATTIHQSLSCILMILPISSNHTRPCPPKLI